MDGSERCAAAGLSSPQQHAFGHPSGDCDSLAHRVGTLLDANVAFEVPRSDALGERLASVLEVVLEVVYLIFNEG